MPGEHDRLAATGDDAGADRRLLAAEVAGPGGGGRRAVGAERAGTPDGPLAAVGCDAPRGFERS